MSLPKQSEDFPGWYQEVVKRAEMAEPSLARGTMVIRPYGYAIWEAIQSGLDRRIKETGHQNLYFPMFIPYKLLEKEADHVEGFSPQVAMVTHAGGEKLEEPLVIRPTSETIIWATYAKWIQSYRDLPLLYNQWANVVRWEMRTRLFLRTTEFLWQEGHTAHETAEEAMQETRMILDDVYRSAVEEDFALPVLMLRKSKSERFPGAAETYAIEALMRDAKGLQSGTSHYFAQNFSRAYDVKFLGRDGKEEFPYSSSWGVSTRLIGGLIMAHGDDAGLRIPPRIAPVQVVIVPIYRSDDERSRVLESASNAQAAMSGVRVQIDDRDQHRPGYKFTEWELKGVPIRLEIGPKDVDAGQIVVVRRDTGEKSSVSGRSLESEVQRLLDEIQKSLFDQALQFRSDHTIHPSSFDELKEWFAGFGGFAVTGWCGDTSCEERIKDETKATNRGLTLDPIEAEGDCIVCGRNASETATWAQAY
jgi:prolyl-tRNA synthetase